MIARQRRRSTGSRKIPEVVVAIKFIAGDRAERAQKEFASVANLLKRYLKHPHVLRKPNDLRWPTVKALARMSRVKQLRWGAMQQQAQIDLLLSRVLVGERLEDIFKLDRGPRGRRGHGGPAWNAKRNSWMLAEVIWLMEQEHISRSEAESLVAGAYDVAYPGRAVSGDSLKMVQPRPPDGSLAEPTKRTRALASSPTTPAPERWPRKNQARQKSRAFVS